MLEQADVRETPGLWLRKQREAAGLTQEELALRSGLSVRTVSNLEHGTRRPYPRSVRLITDALGLTKGACDELIAKYRSEWSAGSCLGSQTSTDRVLAVKPGAEAGLGLTQLNQRELSAGSDLTAEAVAGQPGPSADAADVAPELPVRVVPRQLPTAVQHFTGRDAELAALNAQLRTVRTDGTAVVIAVIDGAPGIGKTSLAVQWAQQTAAAFPDGQLYVDLRGFDRSGEVMAPETAIRGFLEAFQIPAEQVPSSPQSQAGLYRSLLAGKRVLIVADNARDAGQVRPLLPGSPGCLVLVTSRARLTGLAAGEGAQLLTLDVMSAGEARKLLAARVGAGRARAEPGAIDQLARLCGRHPLALTVAAARGAAWPQMSLTALAAELAGAAGRLTLLETGDPVTDVRTVFSWSCRQLDELPARMFRLLGVHPGPDITVPATAALLSVSQPQARAGLGTLTMANLISEHVPGRFALHDLLRDYAVEQAAEQESQTGRHDAIQRALDFYLHTSRAAALLLDPGREPVTLNAAQPGVTPEPLADSQQALAWFEAEHRVLMAAIAAAYQAGSDARAWQLPWAIDDFLNWRGHWQDWAAAQRIALAAATRLRDVAGQATARRLLSHTFARSGDYVQARAHLTRCLGLYRQVGDQAGEGRAQQDLGCVAELESRNADALSHAEQALALYQAAGDRARQAAALNNVGWCLVLTGNYERARTVCWQAVTLHRQLGHRRGEASSWDSLGYAEHKLGRFTEAADCHRRAIGIVRELGDRYDEAEFLTHLGDVGHTANDRQQARKAWQQALDILENLHHPDAAQVRIKLRQHQPLRGTLAAHYPRESVISGQRIDGRAVTPTANDGHPGAMATG